MNFVTLAPRHLLMPAGCPRTRARYEARGIRVEEVDVSEYLLAAGGIGCATGVLARG
jgi:N-dimethylarginine dimethylaminohydrolase